MLFYRAALRDALTAARKAGHAFVVIDGILIAIDRLAADRPFYSGKNHRHGMNLLPGAVHDLTTARIWGLIRETARTLTGSRRPGWR